MYTVYILKCADGTLYTGMTNDIEKRMLRHNNGRGAKYVRARLPFELMYTEACKTRSDACKREYEIKQMRREQKNQLINK